MITFKFIHAAKDFVNVKSLTCDKYRHAIKFITVELTARNQGNFAEIVPQEQRLRETVIKQKKSQLNTNLMKATRYWLDCRFY